MKITLLTSALLVLGASVSFAETAAPSRSSLAPVGNLTINRAFVRTGVKPLLNWEIQYPKTVRDMVEIGAQDQITTRERSLMEVRVVGAAFQVGSTHTDLELKSSVGGSAWDRLFLGNDSEPDPSQVVLSQVVEAGTRIDFSARASNGRGSWYSTRDTAGRNSVSLQALTNGDSVPHYVPAYRQDTVESFLSQYISSEDEVTIGPRDIIYLIELYSTDPDSSYFDMQDLVVVVSFKDIP